MTPLTTVQAPPGAPDRPVGAGFILGFAIAHVGAFVSFVPLLSILVPLKAAEIDPAGKAAFMAQVSLMGAVAAGLANLAAGAISDRTRSRFGRRRPWMALGLAGTALSYLVIMQARDFWGLLAGLLAFQVCFNFLFAPLVAILADRVPDAQKGRVAAFAALAPPLGVVSGMLLAGALIPSEALRYAALVLVIVAAVAPFALGVRDQPTDARAWLALAPRPPPEPSSRPQVTGDFAAAWISRLLVQITLAVVMIYALFYLQDAVRDAPVRAAEANLAWLMTLATGCQVLAGLAGGFLSDRQGRRKPFVFAGGACLAAAALTFAFAPTWTAVVAAFALYGVGFGLFQSVDAALVAQVLPSLGRAGRDLAVLNLANTLPQVIAPALGLALLQAGRDYTGLFAFAGAAALLGAVTVYRIRSVA